MACVFCDRITADQVLLDSNYFKLIFDIDPIQAGHLLLISKRHVMSLTELFPKERYELIDLETELVHLLEQHLPINGVTVVSNDSELMDEGLHFHRHLIPRCTDDGFWDGLDLLKEDWDLSPFLEALVGE